MTATELKAARAAKKREVQAAERELRAAFKEGILQKYALIQHKLHQLEQEQRKLMQQNPTAEPVSETEP